MVENDQRNGRIPTITKTFNSDGPIDYEKLISIAGFGLFNALLVLAALPVAWTVIFDTTTGAFLLASAECDLDLNFFRKGVLVASPYIGMITTSFLWDFVTDHVGKRTLIILGLLANAVLNILSTSVDSYYLFLLIKFLSGSLIGGPLANLMPYLLEFHAAKYKASFAKWTGLLFAIANIVPAALAFTILPLHWSVDIFGRNYNSWRIYLLICSIPPVLGLLTFSILPESPKQLMASGELKLALRLLRIMYRMNTKNPSNTFPIKGSLAIQKLELPKQQLKTTVENMREFWYNTKLLLSRPYLPAFATLSLVQFGSMVGFNTMRLWIPHLFIILANYDWANWKPDGRQPTICEMLDRRAAIPAQEYYNCTNFDNMCIDWTIHASVYQNSTMIATSAVTFGFLVGFVIRTRFRKIIVLVGAFLISLVSSLGINWAQAPPYMLTLGAAVIVTGRIAGNVVTPASVDAIPVPLRATSASILLTIGNVAAIVGNIVFSVLLQTVCLSSYMVIAALFAVCLCVSCVLPHPVRRSPSTLAQT